MSHSRQRQRIESPEEPIERVSVFDRLGPKRISVQTNRTIDFGDESDLRSKMSRKRPATEVSPSLRSPSPVRSVWTSEKSDSNSKVKSMVSMAVINRPESPTSSARRGKHPVQIDEDTDSDALERKRLELLEMLEMENKNCLDTDKKLKTLAVTQLIDVKTQDSSRSSSIISSESSSTLKSMSKTESSDTSDKKVIKSSAVIEDNLTKIVEKKARVSSSISLKTIKHPEELIIKPKTDVKYDRHGNIRISLDEQERQKRLRAERFGPIDEKSDKTSVDRKKTTSRERSLSPPPKKTRRTSSSRHHLSDSAHVERGERRGTDSRPKRGSGHSHDTHQRSRSRERSQSYGSNRGRTQSKAGSGRSSRADIDSKYRDIRDNISVTSKTSRKQSGNFSADHSPVHSSRSKLSLERESSIESDFSRRSKSERMSTLSTDALLVPKNSSEMKINEDLNASDPIIEQMSPISADSSIPDVDDNDSVNKPIRRKKSKSEESISPKKDTAVADGESDPNLSDWSDGEDELLLKTDGFETMDEICNISDNSLPEKDTWKSKKKADKDEDVLEAISDDELENIIGDSDPMDSTSESRQVMDALDIDWKSLVSEPKPKLEFVPGSARKRFHPANVLMKIGFSQKLAGPDLSRKLIDFCKEELKEEFVPFRHPIAAIHSLISDRVRERQQLFGTDTSQSTVLTGRKDLQIRKMLNKTNFKIFDNCMTSSDTTSSAIAQTSTSSVDESLVSSTNPIDAQTVSDIECF